MRNTPPLTPNTRETGDVPRPYLGLNTIAQESHPETGIDLTYISQSGDTSAPPAYAATGGDRYVGLDQFGRVDDQFYVNPSSVTSPTDRFQYSFDSDGNVLYKDVAEMGGTAATFSQLYHASGGLDSYAFDGQDRETNFEQGTLSHANASNGSGVLDTVASSTQTQALTLDSLGNWDASSVTGIGTTEARTFNAQNQITNNSGSTTPTYDHDGNVTEDDTGNTQSLEQHLMAPRRHDFRPQTRRDDEATQPNESLRRSNAVWGRKACRPKGGPEKARLLRCRASTYRFVDMFRPSASHPGLFRPIAGPLGVVRGSHPYTAWNQLATSAANGQEFIYLPNGPQATMSICAGSTVTYSYYSTDWQDVEDDAPGGAVSTYVWGLENQSELVERDDGSGNRLYAQHDANMDVTALVNTSGSVVERFSYTPNGIATVLTPSWTSTTDSYNWIFRWQGGRYNTVDGLYTFGYRDYSPTLGTWLEEDPSGYAAGPNVYQAMLGAPIEKTDPYGLQPGPTTVPTTSTGTGSSGSATPASGSGVTTSPATGPNTQPQSPGIPPPVIFGPPLPTAKPLPSLPPPAPKKPQKLGPPHIVVITKVRYYMSEIWTPEAETQQSVYSVDPDGIWTLISRGPWKALEDEGFPSENVG